MRSNEGMAIRQGDVDLREAQVSATSWNFGLAWLGLAWLGLAWLGLAWLGLAVKAFSAHTAPKTHRWRAHSLRNIATSCNSLYKETTHDKYCYCWSAVVVHRTQPYNIPHYNFSKALMYIP
jgi:hypothetical protein